jgi:hypothetical protein
MLAPSSRFLSARTLRFIFSASLCCPWCAGDSESARLAAAAFVAAIYAVKPFSVVLRDWHLHLRQTRVCQPVSHLASEVLLARLALAAPLHSAPLVPPPPERVLASRSVATRRSDARPPALLALSPPALVRALHSLLLRWCGLSSVICSSEWKLNLTPAPPASPTGARTPHSAAPVCMPSLSVLCTAAGTTSKNCT